VTLLIERLGKVYCCPLKSNRLADDSGGQEPYRRADSSDRTEAESARGKRIRIRGFPKCHRVRLFRVEVSDRRTERIVTNDQSQDSTQATQEVCGFRRKIERSHRESERLTGPERCQCRKARIQRNHIGCAFLVWTRLKQIATQTGKTVYQVKRSLPEDYLIQQLRKPSLKTEFA